MGLLSRLFGADGVGYCVGDTISLGPFEWRIISRRGDVLTLITEEVVDCAWYQRPMQRNGQVRWADCSLRRYLNGAFISENFTDEQAGCMRRATIHNDPDPYTTAAEADTSLDTKDMVYCLSVAEAWEYFEKPSTRRAKASQRAIQAGVHADSEGCTAWWLRSNLNMMDGFYVNNRGSVLNDWVNAASKSGVGVRPVITISLAGYKRLYVKTSER